MTETTKYTAETMLTRIIREIAVNKAFSKYACNGDMLNALLDAGAVRWNIAACDKKVKALDEFAEDGTHALTIIDKCADELAREMTHGIN